MANKFYAAHSDKEPNKYNVNETTSACFFPGYPHSSQSKKAGSIIKKPIKIFQYSWMVQLSCVHSEHTQTHSLFPLSPHRSCSDSFYFAVDFVAVVDCLFQISFYRQIHFGQTNECVTDYVYVVMFVCKCVILSNEKEMNKKKHTSLEPVHCNVYGKHALWNMRERERSYEPKSVCGVAWEWVSEWALTCMCVLLKFIVWNDRT